MLLTGVSYHNLGEMLALGKWEPNLYIDIARIATPDGIALLAEAFGPERLFFGSDYPSLQVGCGAMLLRDSGLCEEAQKLVAWGNAERLFEGAP